jgi:hypothetical protein
MKLFRLNRRKDPTGVSGPGIVAEGVFFGDGSAVVRWMTEPYHSTVFWPGPDAPLAIEAVHGHDGSTVMEWWGSDGPVDSGWSASWSGLEVWTS